MRLPRTPLGWLIVGLLVFLVLMAVLVFSLRGGSDEEAGSPVARCVERFLVKPHDGDTPDEELAAYVQRAYCEPFARRGWVYWDGAFRLAAYTKSGTSHCEEASPSGVGRTVRCPPDPVLDCALLDMVRRSQAQAYIASLAHEAPAPVRCDDDRALASIGAE